MAEFQRKKVYQSMRDERCGLSCEVETAGYRSGITTVHEIVRPSDVCIYTNRHWATDIFRYWCVYSISTVHRD